jgi:hypothetical protein
LVRDRFLRVADFELEGLTVFVDLFDGVVVAPAGTPRHSKPHRTAIVQFRIREKLRILIFSGTKQPAKPAAIMIPKSE